MNEKKADINPTINELSNMYQLPYELLLSEYINCGDEYTSVIIATQKKALAKAVSDYIRTSSLENIAPILKHILNNTLDLDDYEKEFFRIVDNSDGNEKIAFSKFNLIAILKLNDLNKPLIRGEEKKNC